MPRKRITIKRLWKADPVYNSVAIARFINNIMIDGKKEKAQKIFYKSMEVIKEKTSQNPLKIFQAAIKNVAPVIEVWPRRIGGATFLIPRQVRANRRFFKAVKWIIEATRNKKGKAMYKKLADEIIAASNQEGDAIKKKNEMHKSAEANKAFVHFGWWNKKKNNLKM